MTTIIVSDMGLNVRTCVLLMQRTPLHFEAQHQFIVQIEGTQHVTLLPKTTEPSAGELGRLARERGENLWRRNRTRCCIVFV